MDYRKINPIKENSKTPQSQPIKGREEEMKENLAGGYAFKASNWQALKRWLIVGSTSNAFYQGAKGMTEDNLDTLVSCVKEDSEKVGVLILEASKKGISVHTPIFAFAYLAKLAPVVFRENFNAVIRTASHLYEVLSYTSQIFGRLGRNKAVRKAVQSWFSDKDSSELEYQFLKYQNRYGITSYDILNTVHPLPITKEVESLFSWIVGGDKKLLESLTRIIAYEKMKNEELTEKEIISYVHSEYLTQEMIPANIRVTEKIMEELFHKMPLTATIRNLGRLTKEGIFNTKSNVIELSGKLSHINLTKAYIHPIVLASAYRVYGAGGRLGKGKTVWTPNHQVLEILEDAIDYSFTYIEPTGLTFFHAWDVSWSMTTSVSENLWLAAYQIEGIMSLAHVKKEPWCFVGGFDYTFRPMNVTKNTSYAQVVDIKSGLWPKWFGGTDAAQAFLYATINKINVDCFVLWTDNESWAGFQHPAEALKEYRKKVNPNAKVIYVTIVPYGDNITLVDPKDKLSFNIAGFTADTPNLINMIAKGEV